MTVNGNGNGWTKWALRALTTFLLTSMLTIMLFVGKSVIANDQLSRSRDEDLRNRIEIAQMKVSEKIEVAIKEQTKVNQETAVALKGVLIELQYIRQKVK